MKNNLYFNLQTFANGQTTMKQMVNPQVMADMISAGLPKAIKFAPIAKIDDTLVGQPGDTISIPSWEYIGDAKDVEEGAAIDIDQMKSSTTQAKVKKTGKGVEITDEAMLSGHGDPIGEATKQLKMSIASKMDDDIVNALNTTELTKTTAAVISYNGIVDGLDAFAEEEVTDKFLFIHPSQATTLRKDPTFIDKNKYGESVMMTGEIGMIAGCHVVISRRVPANGSTFTDFVVVNTAEPEDGTPVSPAVSLILKRDTQVEKDRDILKKTTVVTVDKHYTVALTNKSKVLKLVFNKQ